jgi:peptidoglycan/LPS O-acetylase OafA/YrhL
VSYRVDIDGLRAIAVAAIVLFHINPNALPGGFVGVDVFFVISGFLITASIRQQLETSRFSLWDFYARRVRRLFPALFAMLAGTSILAYLYLLPSELIEFSKGALATVTYVSNIFFFTQADYFAPAADTTVLLHTWSLSVEEQFYLLLPALLILLRHQSRQGLVLSLLVVACCSLVLSTLLVRYNESAAFFLSPSRFWQFVLGGVTALAMPSLRPRPFLRQIAAAAGTIGLVVCFATYRSSQPFPGLLALPPTIATCLVLYGCSARNGPVWKALALPPLQYLGRWSYSIYLWHWPVIVFYRLTISPTPTPTEQALLALAVVVLGAASYYLVETPTRRMQITRPKLVIGSSLLITCGMAAIAMVPILDNGLPKRFSPDQLAIARHLNDKTAGNGSKDCFLLHPSQEFNEPDCIKGSNGRKRLLLIGDSHAVHFRAMLPKFFPDYDISQATAIGCRPIWPTEGKEKCVALIRRALLEFIPEKKFDLIIISARWRATDAPKLGEFIRNIGVNSRVVVVGPSQEYVAALPRLLVQASLNISPSILERASKYGDLVSIDARIREAVSKTDAEYFSAIDIQCPNARCMATSAAGVPYLYDGHHFTKEGAALILAPLREALEAAPRPADPLPARPTS